MAPICFLDTEATGLGPGDDIWEVACRRRNDDGTVTDLHMFVEHHVHKAQHLPLSFFTDYQTRFDASKARPYGEVAWAVQQITLGATIVGAVPNFDTEKLAFLMRANSLEPKWHYHLIDVENLIVGYLAAKTINQPEFGAAVRHLITPPWNSDELSAAVGVKPSDFDRHTAMGDVLWAEALYDAVMACSPSLLPR